MSSFTTNTSSSGSSDKGLIFCGVKNEIVYDQVKQRLIDGRRDSHDMNYEFTEFDGVNFLIKINKDTPSIIEIHIMVKTMNELKKLGSQELLDEIFPGLEISAESNYNYAIKIDCDIISEESKDDLLNKISSIKKYCEGGPLKKSLKLLEMNSSIASNVISLKHRNLESIYICPRDDKVVIVIVPFFKDPTERAFAKVFLQEFVEAQRTIRNAPTASFGPTAPRELNSVSGINDEAQRIEIAGYMSFAVESRHVKGNHMDIVMDLLLSFRTYLSYHIKCSKTYLHMRMRNRTDEWMKVLERAKPHVESDKKTFSGRTFNKR